MLGVTGKPGVLAVLGVLGEPGAGQAGSGWEYLVVLCGTGAEQAGSVWSAGQAGNSQDWSGVAGSGRECLVC